MSSQNLLTDQQMQRFISDGYLLIKADYPTDFHQAIYEKIDKVFAQEQNPGNNILPRIPQIQQVFDHPNVAGALTSLLGPNYLMHAHRHCHLNPPGSPGQRWHKDNYVFDQNIRHPRFRWVLAFYYPQDVSEDMGPTGIISGQQYYHHISDDNAARTTEPELPLCGPAGTIAIVHYDAWHRATANTSTKKRYMLKFLFERMAEPQAPAWQSRQADWPASAHDQHEAANRDVWRWLRGHYSGQAAQKTNVNEKVSDNGQVPLTSLTADLDSPAVDTRSRAADKLAKMGKTAAAIAPKLIATLKDASEAEAVRLNVAYALGSMGEAVIPLLKIALREEAHLVADHFMDKMPGNVRGDNPAALYSADALAVIGEPAIPILIELLSDDHWCVRATAADTIGNIGITASAAIPALTERLQDEHNRVRRHAAEALGRIGKAASETVPALIKLLSDDAMPVRYNAALALARIGPAAETAIPALVATMSDEDRYVRYFATVALRRIGTQAAQEALLTALFTSRWCPLTSTESMY